MLLEELLKLYFKNVTDKLEGHRREIFQKLLLEPDVNIKEPSFPEGSNSNNRLKYFDQKRPYFVCKVLEKIYPVLPSRGYVLDLGCGIGDFCAMFNALGYEAVGVNGGPTWYLEDFRYCCDLLKITVLYLDVTKGFEDIQDKHFDLVFASEILTLGSLIDKQNLILEELNRLAKNIVVVNHHNRQLTYQGVPYKQFPSPEI